MVEREALDWRVFYNPLAVLGKVKGVLFALLAVIILAGVALWGGVHIGEALPLYVTANPPAIKVVALESLIAWLSLAVSFFAVSKALGGNGGFGSHLAAAGLGRFPYIFAVIILSKRVLGGIMLKVMATGGDGVIVRHSDAFTPGLFIGVLGIFLMIAWAIVILYLGFKVASRLTGGRAAAGFVIGAVVAEAISWFLVRMV